MIADPILLEIISDTAQTVFNYHCADLIKLWINLTTLGWTSDEQGASPAGNIDQMALDILRRLLTANIKRYLISAGRAHHREQFSVCQHKWHARNYLQKSSWFTPTRSVPDRQWSADLADDTMNKMLLIKEHLKGVSATIDTAMSNMEKVTRTLETGGAQQYLFKDD